MKKILTLFAVVGLIVFSSCEGPEGPPGKDGGIFTAEVIEVNGYNFNTSNGYRKRYDFKPEIFPGDMVLVYRLVAVENGVKVWNALPETSYYDNGDVHFNYQFEFSRFDVDIFINGSNFNTIPSGLLSNQTFRIVVVPGDGVNLTSKKSINLNDYNAVIKAYDINESQIQKVNF